MTAEKPKTKSLAEQLADKKAEIADKPFSGIARSVQAFDNMGFSNFRIVTLYIRNDKVIKKEFSDPYANFETISKMELINEVAIHHLNFKWKDGDTLSK